MLVHVQLSDCFVYLICLFFQRFDVAVLQKTFLAFADNEKTDEYFNQIHAWNDYDLDHFPALENGKGRVDIVQEIWTG